MFKLSLPIFRAVQTRSDRLPKAGALLAALSATAVGCALEPREGDGLKADWRDVTISASTVNTPPTPPAGTSEVVCKAFELFNQSVFPLLNAKHDGTGPADMPPPGPQACSECHDGTKQKAIVAMFIDPLDAGISCQVALAREIKEHDILSSSNPMRPDVVHDFKFKSIEDYNRFRDVLVTWLQAEGITATQ